MKSFTTPYIYLILIWAIPFAAIAQNAKHHIKKGDKYMLSEMYGDAASEFKEALVIEKNNPDAHTCC